MLVIFYSLKLFFFKVAWATISTLLNEQTMFNKYVLFEVTISTLLNEQTMFNKYVLFEVLSFPWSKLFKYFREDIVLYSKVISRKVSHVFQRLFNLLFVCFLVPFLVICKYSFRIDTVKCQTKTDLNRIITLLFMRAASCIRSTGFEY